MKVKKMENISNKILPVVVLYNIRYENCIVYRSLLQHYKMLHIFVYDNSPSDINSDLHNANDNIRYIHDKSNGGVSAAYNAGYLYAREINADFLLLLDQDTLFDSQYIETLSEAIKTNPQINVFAAQVICNDKPFSPSQLNIFSVKTPRLESGIYKLKQYKPINSGTCVSLDIFDNAGGYNEKIKLDFADYEFFSRKRFEKESFLLLDSVAIQNFSNDEKDVENLYARYKIYLEGAKESRRTLKGVILFVIKHTIALTVRTKSLKFIKLMIKYKLI